MAEETGMKRKKTAALVLSTIGTALLILVIVLCLPITIPRLFGYSIYTVVSGSMEPAIPIGSLVYTKEIAPENVAEGDVIAFYSSDQSGAVITHRVVTNRVISGDFITKGDANDTNDLTPIPYDNLVGKVSMTIPFMGRYLSAIATPFGRIATACLVAIAVILQLMAGRMRREERQD